MAASSEFKRDDSVLMFDLRDHLRGVKYAQRHYLLWPVWVYRVLVPIGEASHLNVLQKAALGLCHAGRHEVQQIADSLDIHINLAKEIILELQQNNLINNHGLPTEKGKQALLDEIIQDNEKMVLGHVFQDPFTHELWPRFVQELNRAELNYDEHNHPRLVLGKKGKPFYQWAYQYLASTQQPKQPAAKSIIEAIRKHQNTKKHGYEWQTDEEDYVSYADKELEHYLSRVSLVDKKPQAMFLATYFYVDENEGDWYVCDPFGFGPSLFLYDVISKQLYEPNTYNLQQQVQALLQKGLDSSLEDINKVNQILKEKANINVHQKLPYLKNDNLHEIFLNMELEYIRVKEQKTKSKHTTSIIFNSGRKALEGIFFHAVIDYKNGDEWEILPKNTSEHSNIYCQIAEKIGFNTKNYTHFSTNKKNIKKIIEENKPDNLSLLLSACLLVANFHDTHPMYNAAKLKPNLLHQIKEIKSYGNKGSHYTLDENVESEKIDEYVTEVYEIASLFFSKKIP